MSCRRLAVTPGEPAGIGPDLVLQIAQQDWLHQLVMIADPALLREWAALLGCPSSLSSMMPPPLLIRSRLAL